jgi:hypothetical protein
MPAEKAHKATKEPEPTKECNTHQLYLHITNVMSLDRFLSFVSHFEISQCKDTLDEAEMHSFWEDMMDDVWEPAVHPPAPTNFGDDDQHLFDDEHGAPAGHPPAQPRFEDDDLPLAALLPEGQGGRTLSMRLFSSPDVLKLLCPSAQGVALTQDFREHRFKAKYVAESDDMTEGVYAQKEFSRTYTTRTPRDALQLVCEWLWTKHAMVTGELCPQEADIDDIVANFGEAAVADVLSPAMGNFDR